MRVTEEARWNFLDLLYFVFRFSISSIGNDANGGRPSQTSDGATDVVVTSWLGEGETRWARCATDGFVDVSICLGR